jgi:hypothetical protein
MGHVMLLERSAGIQKTPSGAEKTQLQTFEEKDGTDN